MALQGLGVHLGAAVAPHLLKQAATGVKEVLVLLVSVDHLVPGPEPTQHALDLGRDELNIGLIVVGRACMGDHESPHFSKRGLINREEVALDVRPEFRLLKRDGHLHHTTVCRCPEQKQ